jgi:hypothetical protein
MWTEMTYMASRALARRHSWNAAYLSSLAPNERTTLFRIANGDDRSGTHNPVDVKRLQLLALIEDEGPFIHVTALGKQRGGSLGRR